MKPIATIHPNLFPLRLATVPSEPRNLRTVRIFQPDELFADVTRHVKQSKEYSDLQLEISNDCITAYRVISSGVATVKECVHVDSNLHVKLIYEGCPIPLLSLLGYIDRAEGTKLTSLDMLTNHPLNPDKYIYLLFDTVHLVKNIRNNLLATRCSQIPALETTRISPLILHQDLCIGQFFIGYMSKI